MLLHLFNLSFNLQYFLINGFSVGTEMHRCSSFYRKWSTASFMYECVYVCMHNCEAVSYNVDL